MPYPGEVKLRCYGDTIAGMEQARDPEKARIEQIASAEAIESAFATAARDLNYEIGKALKRPADATGTWTVATIRPFLEECRALVEKSLRRDASHYSAARWLWYLRRLPNYKVNAPFAEIISGMAGSSAGRAATCLNDRDPSFPIHESVIRRVLKFWGGTHYLSGIFGLLRSTVVGADFRFSDGATLPSPILPAEKREAMQLFDGRLRASRIDIFNRVGTVIASSNPAPKDSSKAMLIIDRDKHDSRYEPRFITLEELTALNEDPCLAGREWWDPRAGSIALLLSLAPYLVLTATDGLGQLHRYGYVVVAQRDFEVALNEHFGEARAFVASALPSATLPTDPDGFISYLDQCSGSLWPVRPGPLIRREGVALCLDLFFATWHLSTLFEYPKEDGGVGNVRAKHFELAIQKIIDSSPWAPSKDIAKYRRRTLKRNGVKITDIDAIAARGEDLLLVDCISAFLSSKYETAQYSEVHNAASRIEQKVEKWRRKMTLLRDHPRGDNYDFSGFRRIIGVVCTTDLFYVPLGSATQFEAPGLRAACSAVELTTWVQ